MHLFCLAACFLVCVRASGHGVCVFVLHRLGLERMFVFLIFALGFFDVPWRIVFFLLVLFGVTKRAFVLFGGLFFGLCPCIRPWCSAFSIFTRTGF